MEQRGERPALEHGREVGVDQDFAVRSRDAPQRAPKRSAPFGTAGATRTSTSSSAEPIWSAETSSSLRATVLAPAAPGEAIRPRRKAPRKSPSTNGWRARPRSRAVVSTEISPSGNGGAGRAAAGVDGLGDAGMSARWRAISARGPVASTAR